MIIIIGYNSPIQNLLQSIPSNIPILLFNHSDKRYDKHADRENVIYFPYYQNRGLSKSWNEGLEYGFSRGAKSIILINDDCVFKNPADVQAMLTNGQHEAGTIAANLAAHAFSCIAISRQCWQVTGCFDENFFPAYFEDVDYARRVTLSGLNFTITPAVVEHNKSFAYHNNELLRKQQLQTFPKNHEYYKRKWGGKSNREKYTKPFNKFDLYIPYEQRSAPYPGYNRTDHNIVKI